MGVKNIFSKETHPWNYFIPDGATRLLIGTFPTESRNRRLNFFYCSSTNRFWKVLSTIASIHLSSQNELVGIKERKNILGRLKLGLTDMGKEVYRQQGSSKDQSLFPVEFMDVSRILHDFPTITEVIVSGSSKSNSSLKWFGIFCSISGIYFDVRKLEKERATEIFISNRNVRVVCAYSTSRLSPKSTEVLEAEYKKIFGELNLM